MNVFFLFSALCSLYGFHYIFLQNKESRKVELYCIYFITSVLMFWSEKLVKSSAKGMCEGNHHLRSMGHMRAKKPVRGLLHV